MSLGGAKAKLLSKFGLFKKFFYWFAGTFIVFVLILVGTFVFLEKKYPPEEYKEKLISQAIESGFVKHLEIGKLSWKFSILNFSAKAIAQDTKLESADSSIVLSASKAQLSLTLWRLLFLKIPITLDIDGVILEKNMSLTTEATSPGEEPTGNVEIKSRNLPAWLRYVSLRTRIQNTNVNLIELEGYEVAELKNLSLDFKLNGIPGTYELGVSFEPIASSDGDSTYVSGKTEFHMSGGSRLQDGYFVGFTAENYRLNFDDNLLVGFGFLEKTPGYEMSLEGGLNFIFSPDFVLRKVEFLDNKLFLSALQVNLQAQYSIEEGLSVNWALPETRVENLFLPVKYLRLLPFKGIVESKIYMLFPPKKKPTVDWQIAFNNLYADVAKVEGLFDSTSSGELLLSVTSKGRYLEGRIDSPKIEAHIDGTQAALFFNQGQFRKKKGDRFEILLKSMVKNDALKIQNFKGFMHTLEFKASGSLKNFSSYVDGKPGELDFAFVTNRVHLRDWSTSLNFLVQSPPLEGFAQIGASVSGEILRGQESFDNLNWRVDRVNFTNVRGSFDPKELVKSRLLPKNTALEGRFHVDLSARGRGKGRRIENASFDANIDLTDLGLIHGAFKKEVGVPFRLISKAQVMPNTLTINRGKLLFHTADLNFSGALRQGQQGSKINLTMNKPVELIHWKNFFPDAASPLKGLVSWKGAVSLPSIESFSKGIDWMDLAIDGRLDIKNLRGRLPGKELVIDRLDSVVDFGNGVVKIMPSILKSKEYDLKFNGAARPIGGRTRHLSFARLMSSKAWNLDFDINLDQLNLKQPPGESSKATGSNGHSGSSATGSEEQADLLAFLKNEYVKESILDLSVGIKKGKLGSFFFDNLKAKANWKNQNLKLSPFSAQLLSGAIAGGVEINARPFYLRNQDPQMRSTLKISSIDLSELVDVVKPEMKGLIDGKATGQVVLSSSGINVDSLVKSSRGRITADIKQGYFQSFKFLNDEINTRITQSALNKWLVKEAKNENCIKENFNSKFDASIEGGKINIALSKFDFLQTDSSVAMKGLINPDLTADLSGDFLAGDRCLRGDVRKCLGAASGRAAIPFTIKGPLANAKSSVDVAKLANKVESCVKTTIVKKAESQIKKELKSNPKVQELKKDAANKLKSIFQGP